MFTNQSYYRLIGTSCILMFCLALGVVLGSGMAFAADVQVLHPAVVGTAVVPGVTTAGTVHRVNNLDNLELMLNTIANTGLFLGVLISLILVNRAQFNGRLSPKQKGIRFAMAAMIALLALSLPGVINGLVASARDATLCDNFF